MLKGSAAAMPTVLTLQSGAAYARTSNLLSVSQVPYRDGRGRLLCLDLNSVNMVERGGNVADLGLNPSARVVAISERDYRVAPDPLAGRISEERACLEGRTVYYVESGVSSNELVQDVGEGDWLQARVPRGAFVSATALASFAGNITVDVI